MSVEQVHLPPMTFPLVLSYTVHYSPWWALRNHNFIHYTDGVTAIPTEAQVRPISHLSQLTRQYRTETIHLPQSCTRKKKTHK